MRASVQPTRHSWFWSAACLVSLCAATGWLYATRAWHRFGVPPIGPERPPFSDAHAQLVTADACLAGAGTWLEGVCFVPSIDILPHAQSYEPWLSISRLGMGHEHYVAVGWTMVVAFYLATVLLFRPTTWRSASVFLALMLSPAVQLAVERANFDLLVATLLIASAWLLSRDRRATSVLGCALLGVATMLKVYSGLSTLFAWLAASTAHRRAVAGASALACLVAITVLGPANILVLGQGAPEGATRFSTGAHLTFDRFGPAPGFMIVATAFASCAWLGRSIAVQRHTRVPIEAFEPQAAAFTISWLTAVPLFMLKDSYDYRLVLWLPMLALALRLAHRCSGPISALGRVTGASFAFAAFTELACELADSARSPAWIEGALVVGKHLAIWNVVFASGMLLWWMVRARFQRD